MLTLLAAAPILVSAGLILLLKQSSIRSGLAGLAVACAIAAAVPALRLPLTGFADAASRGGLTTLVVAYVLLGGVLLYQVLREGGALDTVSAATTRAIPDPGHRLFSLIFGLSVFFEAVTGFGIGIVVSAPLFVALGYGPGRAALLALLGQCAVPWGALAIGTVLGAELSGVPASTMGTLSVWLGLPFLMLCGVAGLVIAGEWRPLPRRLIQLLLYIGVLAASLWVFSTWVGVELAGCLAGLTVTATGLVGGALTRKPDAGPQAGRSSLARAAIPLAVLVAGLLATRLWPALENWSRGLLVIEVERHGFSLSPVHHPGFWMVVAALVGIATLRIGPRQVAAIAAGALRQWTVATMAVAGFLVLAQVMVDAGMTRQVAASLTNAFGGHYLLLVPWIGALGGFLTASNAGANAMFMQLQTSAANALTLPADLTAAAQNAGAANATLASPGRVVLAAAVTGGHALESRLLRQALLAAVGGTAGTSAVLWLMAA